MNNDLDYTISIQSLVREYFANLKRSYTCVECGSKMKEINTPTKFLLLLYINFSGKEFMFEAERELNLFDSLWVSLYSVLLEWTLHHRSVRLRWNRKDVKFQSIVGKIINFYGRTHRGWCNISKKVIIIT